MTTTIKPTTAAELQELLAPYIGTTKLYVRSKHPPYDTPKYTEGVRAMAAITDGYWLLQIITSYMPKIRADRRLRQFALVRLTTADNRATLEIFADTEYDDGTPRPPEIAQQISHTDFPAGVFELFLQHETLMLTTEY